MDLGPLCTKENMFARARVHVRDGKRRVILLMLSNAQTKRLPEKFAKLLAAHVADLNGCLIQFEAAGLSLTNQMVIFCHSLGVPQVWHMPKLSYGTLWLPPKQAHQGEALGAASELMFV